MNIGNHLAPLFLVSYEGNNLFWYFDNENGLHHAPVTNFEPVDGWLPAPEPVEPEPVELPEVRVEQAISLTFLTQLNVAYAVQRSTDGQSWEEQTTVTGTGEEVSVCLPKEATDDPVAVGGKRMSQWPDGFGNLLYQGVDFPSPVHSTRTLSPATGQPMPTGLGETLISFRHRIRRQALRIPVRPHSKANISPKTQLL